MGRPWEYPRWRRVLMQAVMLLVLGGTVGLAELVTYHRNHTPIELGPPVQLGEVDVRLPVDWQASGAGGHVLEAQDPETLRVVRITFTAARFQRAEQSADQDGRAVSADPLKFNGLHIQGSMAEVSQYQVTAQGMAREQVLRAAAELPDHKLILIEVYAAQLGPADRLLLQTLANGITPASGKARAVPQVQRQNPQSDDTDDSN